MEAERLYRGALLFVDSAVAPLRSTPRAVFCRSERCYARFGLSRPTAHSFAPLGIVVGPRGWHPEYVRHELIHQVQFERLGALRLRCTPDWFIEGMAYALSDDPRMQLTQPFESHRRRFLAWRDSVGIDAIWPAARRLCP